MTEQNPPKSVPLPILDAPKKAPKMGSTRTGRWRAIILLVVNLLIVAHVIQWLIMGSTVSPVEPSEAMQTLETGVINAGAVLFALALLSTLVFGRFFCGWLCHVVALQDACAWIMNKMGIRPKPFRSRLLVFVPLAMGTYMFIWPSFKRVALAPLLDSAGVDWPAWLRPVQAINLWQTEMIVEDFWATFPVWYIAVPFLLICGFVTVYFLGAKGFCTYACPYGGLFAPADKVAPVRIRVTDACQHCGHCTSVCTSNVRVSDEVRDFGMVVDPGCMKCMDCVTACPSDALYLGIGAPALGKRPRDKANHKRTRAKAARRYDLSWPEEIPAAAVFIACFFAFRGMLDQIPMLLAGGLAAIVTYLIIVAWWMGVRQHARIYGLVLKQKGRIRAGGFVFVPIVLLMVLLVTWGATARYNRWRADIAYAGAVIPAGFVERPEFTLSPESRQGAERAIAWFDRADSFEEGGLGWSLNPQHRTHKAYFLAMLGRAQEAADQLELVIQNGNPGAPLIDQLIRLRTVTGTLESSPAEVYERTLDRHPDLHHIRLNLALLRASATEDPEAGLPVFDAVWDEYRDDVGFRYKHASYRLQTGRADLAMELLPEVIELAEADRHNAAGWLADCSSIAMRAGNAPMALDLIDRATQAKGAHPGVWFAAAEVAGTFGDGALALERIDAALDMPAARESTTGLNRAAGLLMRLGETEHAVTLYRQAAELSQQPFERSQLGQVMIQTGQGLGDAALIEEGLGWMRASADETGEPILYHDLAVMLYRASRLAEAAGAMQTAAERGPDNAELAFRAADMWRFAGDQEKASAWDAEHQRRLAEQSQPAQSASP